MIVFVMFPKVITESLDKGVEEMISRSFVLAITTEFGLFIKIPDLIN